MGLLGKTAEFFKEMGEKRVEQQISRLFYDTDAVEKALRSEAKKFGIDIGKIQAKSYYDALGIKYTNDPKAIRDAYLRLVKKYHPDVSTDPNATKRTEEVNEAYSVLKDKKLKEEYDLSSSKGANRMGQEVTKSISDMVLRKYIEAREKDFDEFRKRVSMPMTRDAAKAAIDEVTEWKKRYNKVTRAIFGQFWDHGRKIKSLHSSNKSLIKGKFGRSKLVDLERNEARLSSLLSIYNELDKGVSSIVASVERKIGSDESKASEKMRSMV